MPEYCESQISKLVWITCLEIETVREVDVTCRIDPSIDCRVKSSRDRQITNLLNKPKPIHRKRRAHTLFVKVFEGRDTMNSFVWLDAFRLTLNSK